MAEGGGVSSERNTTEEVDGGTDLEKIAPHQISVCVCTSAAEWNVQGLLNHLNQSEDMAEYVEKADVLALPYNGLDDFKPDWKDYNMVILCHSIHNRRFAVTDVLDALYDSFLPKAKDHFGPDKVLVIVHDLDWPIKRMHQVIDSFKLQQPTTFNCAKWVYVCGKLQENAFEMDKKDREALHDAMKYAFVNPVKDWSPSVYTGWKMWFLDYLKYLIPWLIGDCPRIEGNMQQIKPDQPPSMPCQDGDPPRSEQRDSKQSSEGSGGWDMADDSEIANECNQQLPMLCQEGDPPSSNQHDTNQSTEGSGGWGVSTVVSDISSAALNAASSAASSVTSTVTSLIWDTSESTDQKTNKTGEGGYTINTGEENK